MTDCFGNLALGETFIDIEGSKRIKVDDERSIFCIYNNNRLPAAYHIHDPYETVFSLPPDLEIYDMCLEEICEAFFTYIDYFERRKEDRCLSANERLGFMTYIKWFKDIASYRFLFDHTNYVIDDKTVVECWFIADTKTKKTISMSFKYNPEA